MRKAVLYLMALMFFAGCAPKQEDNRTVKDVMSDLVTKLYKKYTPDELQKLTNDDIEKMLSPDEKKVLATKYWSFDANVPVNVYVIRDVNQKEVPFWLKDYGFVKTGLTVKNAHYTYDVWKKKFPAGDIGLGINGFDDHRPTYFVSASPVNKGDKLVLSNFYPKGQTIEKTEVGSMVYHDWTELVLTQVPDELKGGQLLTTIRGRAGDSGLIGGFRQTEYPSSEKPDQIMLTWSNDPRTTQSIQWRTSIKNKKGVVRYRPKGGDKNKYKEVEAEPKVIEDMLLANDRYINRFTARIYGLKPATAYNYIVGNPDKNIWSDTSEFITAPEGNEPFSWGYFGDTHKSKGFGELINMAYNRFPKVAFYTIGGDLVSSGLNRDDWDKEFAYSANVIKNRSLMAVPGNHDDANGLGPLMYVAMFDFPKNGPKSIPPEYTYSFEYGDALFLMMYGDKIEEQAKWLENQLKNTDKKWKFVMFHFPPYSFDEDKYPDIVKSWGALFDKYHVDMVFNGHVHYYMRSKPINNGKVVKDPLQGTIYLISIAIPNRGDRKFKVEPFSDKFVQGEMLFQKIDIDGNKLTLNAYNEKGKVIDHFEIVKK